MWLVFIGQNASTGKPNPITGCYSNWGKYRKFNSKKERDLYVEEWSSYNPSEFCRPCGVKSGRQYSLGWTVCEYIEYLNYLPATIKIGNNWEGCY